MEPIKFFICLNVFGGESFSKYPFFYEWFCSFTIDGIP